MISITLILCIFASLLILAIVSETRDGSRPEPVTFMEIVTEARRISRVTGLRLGQAPNQGTRLARFRAARKAGASELCLWYLDLGWSGYEVCGLARGWRQWGRTYPGLA